MQAVPLPSRVASRQPLPRAPQTLDRGFPVSELTVARELGHGGTEITREVYLHLGEIRHPSEHVEYRIEQQREEIPPERLRALLRVA